MEKLLAKNQTLDVLKKAWKKPLPYKFDLKEHHRRLEVQEQKKMERERSVQDMRDIEKFEHRLRESIFNENKKNHEEEDQ